MNAIQITFDLKDKTPEQIKRHESLIRLTDKWYPEIKDWGCIRDFKKKEKEK